MKIIVFGIGEIYNEVKHYFYESEDEIVALIDNSRTLFETLVDGYVVDQPKYIQYYQYDFIVITSNYAIEMRRQLIELGVQPNKIIHFKEYIGCLPIAVPITNTDVLFPRVLILSNSFGYHGGPITSMNLARVLSQKGYEITIVVPDADQKLLDEISSEESIKVIIVENLNLLCKANLEWANGYEYVFANTFIMAQCAIKLAHKRKVYLWLHESIDSYAGYEYWYDEIEKGIGNDNLIIGAVSDVAKKTFLSIYPTEIKIELFPYGIDDKYEGNDFCVRSEVMTFMIIAPHIFFKGMDVLFDALHLIPEQMRKQCRFLFVGKSYDDEYGKSVREQINKKANCEYLGELSRKKLFEMYSVIDIVIVPSRRDSMSLVATEAMMLKRPCIISDAIGMANFVKHKYNGLIFKNENREELAETICWCIKNREALKIIAENARNTYETWFTMEKFGDRVMDIIGELT